MTTPICAGIDQKLLNILRPHVTQLTCGRVHLLASWAHRPGYCFRAHRLIDQALQIEMRPETEPASE